MDKTRYKNKEWRKEDKKDKRNVPEYRWRDGEAIIKI